MANESDNTVFHTPGDGRKHTTNEMMVLHYNELRAMAHQLVSKESSNITVGATDVVNEVFGRMPAGDKPAWDNRAHFYAAAAKAMRDILVDRARRRNAIKRGGGRKRVDLEDIDVAPSEERSIDWEALDATLTRLQDHDADLYTVVCLRFFNQLSVDDTASVMGISDRQVKRLWKEAREWLAVDLGAA